MRHRLILPAALAAATLAAPSADAQVNFTTYVSVGDSLAAGFSNGSLVETHQANSVPALLARQAALAGFQQPLVSEPGIPAELTLTTLVPVPTIAPKAGLGTPKNLSLPRPYNNLAVPGHTVVDAATRLTDTGGLTDLVLRGQGTQVAQALALRPTAITLWIGNNDVLGAALRGRALPGVTLTPTAAFKAGYQQVVTALKATGAFIVAANVPDPTTIPFVTTLKPFVTNPATGTPVLGNGQTIPLLGPTGPLPSSAFVTLAASTLLAQGVGVPTSLGGRASLSGGVCTGCLPDEVVLDAAEVAVIRDHVTANNEAIREICGAASIPVLDVHGLLAEVATTGRNVGGITVTNTFLTGGVFSYDGVHPTDLGYALLANEWIRVINANGGSLPEVDLGPFFGVSAARARSLRAEAPLFEFSAEAYESLLAAFPLPEDVR